METHHALRKRLTIEGRWAEATELYDKSFQEFIDAGIKSRPILKRKAWAVVQAAFPPLLNQVERNEQERLKKAPIDLDPENAADDEPAVPDDELPTDMPTGSTNFDEDLAWAYQNLGANVTAKDAPSGAAWMLREHGRTLKTRGAFVTMAQKAFSTKGSEDIEKNREDRSRQFKLLATLSREFAGL